MGAEGARRAGDVAPVGDAVPSPPVRKPRRPETRQTTTSPAVDRRVVKGERTRSILIEAVLALLDEEASPPTSAQSAERAGVSVRLVFHHFHRVDGLLVRAATVQAERHRDILFVIPAHGPPLLRIRALCRQRRLYYERMTPVYRVAHARAHAAQGLQELLADDRAVLRMQLATTLAPEIEAGGDEAVDLLDLLEQVTGWESWWSLRDTRRHTAPSAERAMIIAVRRLIDWRGPGPT